MSLASMSLRRLDQEYALEERGRFFISSETEGDWDEDSHVDHRQLVLFKADALASENRLKEAVDMFAMALRYGPVRPDQLSSLVGCVLRNFKKKSEESTAKSEPNWTQDCEFDCPGCHSFIADPVTVTCGHTYCRRCLQHSAFSKCKLCSEDIRTRPGEPRLNVILCGLLEKWFPEDVKRTKYIEEAETLLKSKQYENAIALTSQLLESGKFKSFFISKYIYQSENNAMRKVMYNLLFIKSERGKQSSLTNIWTDSRNLCISPALHDHVTGECLYYKTCWNGACALGTRCVRQVVTQKCFVI